MAREYLEGILIGPVITTCQDKIGFVFIEQKACSFALVDITIFDFHYLVSFEHLEILISCDVFEVTGELPGPDFPETGFDLAVVPYH